MCEEPDLMLFCVVQMADNHGDVRKALSTCEAALNMLVDDAHTAADAAGQHCSARPYQSMHVATRSSSVALLYAT